MVSGSVDNTAVMWDINKGLIVFVDTKYVHVLHRLFFLSCLITVHIAYCKTFWLFIYYVGPCCLCILGQKLCILNDHKSYVQGVTWDPLGQYVATLSCDRYNTLQTFSFQTIFIKLLHLLLLS